MWSLSGAPCCALVGSTFFYFQSLRGRDGARSWARQLYALATFAVVLASGVLLFLILRHDFRLHYVFSYSDLSLPTSYLISTFWAGQEGSFLLWLLCGMLVGLPLIRYARHYEDRTLLVYNLAQLSLLLILVRQSPFRFLADLPPGQVPFDGQGLNPLLQNPWMTIHPPIMFVGYAATAVPFAFAVAALWGRQYDEWVKASLPWALLTVVTLGCAILLGGYWAYVTLGWGGYWGWDPVENSSLVPWLASAALVHGMLLQRARGRFRKLNFALAILAYVLVVYATFLTRSGVLADFSVHSFVDLGITGWLVANLVVFLLIGFGALTWRFREIPTQPGDEPFFSRTVFFVLAISALLGTAAMILLGTSAPLITRLATKPSQVGPAFYNKVTLPIGILLAMLLSLVPYLQWRGASVEFRKRMTAAGLLAIVATAVGVALGAFGVLYVAFLFVSLFAFFSNLLKTIDEFRKKRIRVAGGYLAHVGLGLMLAGIITSSAFDRTEKVVLSLGEGKQVMGYTLTFKGVDKPTPTARDAMMVEVRDAGGKAYVARPLMFRNEKSNQLVANPDVKVRLTHDVYVSPIEFDPGRPAEGNTIELGEGRDRAGRPARGHLPGVRHERFARRRRGPHHRGEAADPSGLGQQRDQADDLVDTPGIRRRARGGSRLAGRGGHAGRRQRQSARTHQAGIQRDRWRHRHESVTAQGRDAHLPRRHTHLRGLRPFRLRPPGRQDQHRGRPSRSAASRRGRSHRSTAAARVARSTWMPRIPGLEGVTLRLGRMNANEKAVEVLVLDPQSGGDSGEPASFSVDFSVKPMIGLLWAGLVDPSDRRDDGRRATG